MSKAPEYLAGMTKEEIRAMLEPKRHPVSIAMYGTDNYFNAAAIIRSAHTFLVKEIILIDCPKFYEKASMGTHKWENITHVSLEEFVSGLSKPLVCFERRPGLVSLDLRTYVYPENPILCFGNEKVGTPDVLLNLAKDIVSIPQFGVQNDMNLANAASVVMYDWIVKNK